MYLRPPHAESSVGCGARRPDSRPQRRPAAGASELRRRRERPPSGQPEGRRDSLARPSPKRANARMRGEAAPARDLRALRFPVASAHGRGNQKAVAIHSRGLPQSSDAAKAASERSSIQSRTPTEGATRRPSRFTRAAFPKARTRRRPRPSAQARTRGSRRSGDLPLERASSEGVASAHTKREKPRRLTPRL